MVRAEVNGAKVNGEEVDGAEVNGAGVNEAEVNRAETWQDRESKSSVCLAISNKTIPDNRQSLYTARYAFNRNRS